MSILCVKTRTCLLFCTCVVGVICVTFLWWIEDQPGDRVTKKSWNALVSQAHQHFRELKERPYGQRETEAEPYLRTLGFGVAEYLTADENEERRVGGTIGASSQPMVRYVQTLSNSSAILPVIAIPVLPGRVSSAWTLYNSILRHSSDTPVYFYDLGLRYYEKLDLVNRCKNISSGSHGGATGGCQLRSLDWSSFPAHIMNYKLETYRPLVIHDALNVTGSVLYLSPSQRFRGPIPANILEKARRLGVLGWRVNEDSTSAITHPKSFTFFSADPERYYFHHTIGGDGLLIYNTRPIRHGLMFPWLRCALTFRCISPVGAEDSGCRTYRKPLYLYSGCHHYDLSIMNVALGLMFNFDSTPYTISADEGRFVTSQTGTS